MERREEASWWCVPKMKNVVKGNMGTTGRAYCMYTNVMEKLVDDYE